MIKNGIIHSWVVRYGLLIGVLGVSMSLLTLPQPASAVGGYGNGEIADHALRFVGQPGSAACAYVGKSGGNECKQFVNCIIYAVSGRTQWPVPGYDSGFARAGGQEVSRGAAIRGDIIQIGGDYASNEQHTAIVLTNYGNGSFEVVDSNYNWSGKVSRHNYTPPAKARFWRMGQDRSIVGNLDSVVRVPGGIRASGWSIDRDTATANNVHVYSGTGLPAPGNAGVATTANLNRPDVGAAYPAYGPMHGYSTVVPPSRIGQNTVCAYGINVPGTAGDNTGLACRSIDVWETPYGSLDSVVRVDDGVIVSGWAIDPDTASPIAVHIYGGTGGIGGGDAVATTANLNRPDVGNVYPYYGSAHGYSVFLKTSPQRQTFCAYGINNGPGGNPQLACKSA